LTDRSAACYFIRIGTKFNIRVTSMDLYFSPLACSMASRIAFYEADQDARFIEVDPKTKRTLDGENYRAVHPFGLVPALRTDDGGVLTENAAILQYIADRFPMADLAPAGGMARSRLQQWLCFIGTELHKALFVPLLDKTMPEAGKAYIQAKGVGALDYLNAYLDGRDYLLDRFTVADGYLVTVLNWSRATPVDLAKWPAVAAYQKRLKERPSIARALSEEVALYAAEQKRHKAA
jgi:glutathione S-transferase